MADLGNIRLALTSTFGMPLYAGRYTHYMGGDSAQPYRRAYSYSNNGGAAPLDLGVRLCRGATKLAMGNSAEPMIDGRAYSRQVNGQTQINSTPTNQRVVVSRNGAPIRDVMSTPNVNVHNLPPGTYEVTVYGQGSKRSETWGPTSIAAPSRLTLSGSLAACSSGVAYSDGLDAAGGYGTNTWDIVGSLPSGLSFNTSTGLITGTTTATGTYGLDIGVTQDTKRLWKRVSLTVS